MSESDYSWVGEMKKKLRDGDVNDPYIKEVMSLHDSGEQPINAMKFDKFERELYDAEVGVRGSDIIYHFFTKKGTWPAAQASARVFEDVMGDAFLEVYKLEDKLQAAYSEELISWAVRVVGFGDNLAIDMLKERVFDVLDRRLKL
jgi:hypothetical protein